MDRDPLGLDWIDPRSALDRGLRGISLIKGQIKGLISFNI